MRVQAFITSGILEKYVLGMVTEEEKQEVLGRASQHIEVKEELTAIRKTLQGYILSHEVRPPEGLKNKVLSLPKRKTVTTSRSEPASRTSSYSFTSKSEKKEKLMKQKGKRNPYGWLTAVKSEKKSANLA